MAAILIFKNKIKIIERTLNLLILFINNKNYKNESITLWGATANKILSYRDENGEFKSIEEIKNVNGIGDKKFENMKDLICVK